MASDNLDDPSDAAGDGAGLEPDQQTEMEAAVDEGEESPKSPAKFRWWTIIAVPVIALGAAATVWIGGDSMLTNAVRDTIEARGLQLSDKTTLEAQFLGGKIALVDADIIASGDTETRSIYQSPRTAIDIAVIDTITSGDVVLEELSMQDATIDFRRWPDGTIPAPHPTPEEIPPDLEEEPQEPPRDWLETYERVRVWYARARDWMPEGDDEPKQPVKEAPGWEQAKRYYPTPESGSPLPLPQVIIRKLDLTGTELRLPDATGPDGSAPLDLKQFSITGSNVAIRNEPDTKMDLGVTFQTNAAGDGSLALQRDYDSGVLKLNWDQVPLQVMTAAEIAGDSIAQWRPSGTAVVAVNSSWQGDQLTGTIRLDLLDLVLNPTPAAGSEAGQVTAGLDKLRKLHQSIAPEEPFVLTWELDLGGSPRQPKILNLGVGSMVEAITDQTTQLAKRKAEAALAEAESKAKEIGKEIGKEVIEDIKDGNVEEAVDSAVDKVKDLGGDTDKLRNLFGR